MKLQTFNLGKGVGKAVESVLRITQLVKAEVASKYLPQDTKFAIVVEAIEKGINESFIEQGIETPTLNYSVTNEGIKGRFVGYISVSDTQLKVYKILDLDFTKEELINLKVVDNLEAKLIFEEMITNIASEDEYNSPIIKNTEKKIKITETYQIFGDKNYISNTTGGTRPLFSFIKARGANVKVISIAKGLIPVILIATLIIGAYILLNS